MNHRNGEGEDIQEDDTILPEEELVDDGDDDDDDLTAADDNGNGNGNEEGEQEGEEEGGLLRIQDLEHYIRSRAIEGPDVPRPPNLNAVEARRRADEAVEYQRRVHREIFGGGSDEEEDGDDEDGGGCEEKKGGTMSEWKRRKKVVETLEGWTLEVTTTTTTTTTTRVIDGDDDDNKEGRHHVVPDEEPGDLGVDAKHDQSEEDVVVPSATTDGDGGMMSLESLGISVRRQRVDDIDNDDYDDGEKRKTTERRQEEVMIISGIPLGPLVLSCDTVYRKLCSEPYFGGGTTASYVVLPSRNNAASSSASRVGTGGRGSNVSGSDGNHQEGGGTRVKTKSNGRTLRLSLTQFHTQPMIEFLSLLLLPLLRQSSSSSSASTTTSAEEEEEVLSPEHIVECCQIAHFLQCPTIVHTVATILQNSIDSHNCLSLCHLADTLSLTELFEASLSHMLSRLDNFTSEQYWEDIPRELQCRIITMKNAVQSSLLGRGTKSGVFFSSSEEFLAIFSDTLREQRERLHEAKRRQDEIVQQRGLEERRMPRGLLGRRYRNPIRPHEESKTPTILNAIEDAEVKIARQERRIRTMEVFYEEQKTIFASTAWKETVSSTKRSYQSYSSSSSSPTTHHHREVAGRDEGEDKIGNGGGGFVL